MLSISNSFPKLLLLYSDKYVTKTKISDMYYLDSVEYMDYLTDKPISYNVYIQQTNITEDRTILWTKTKLTTYYTIQSIVRNNLDTTSRSEASLNFKVYPKINLISVKYVSFSEVLSTFGSYYAVFTLIAQILCQSFSSLVYEGDLVNCFFRFYSVDDNFTNFDEQDEFKGREKNKIKAKCNRTNFKSSFENIEEEYTKGRQVISQ